MDSNNDKNSLNAQIQYKMIEKLSAMNEQLKEEVLVRKKAEQQLRKNNQELEKALQVKSDFLSTMSHEIRTPLNIIIGYTQLMIKSKPEPEDLEQVESIKFAADSLLNIVDQILQYSSMDKDSVELFEENFDLHHIGKQFHKLFHERATEKALDFNISIDPTISDCLFGDAKKVHQVIYNILGNAFKYTESGAIDFCMQLESNLNDLYWIRFVVTDTGIGMDKNEIKSIFERFIQVQTNIKREYGGVGLGLAISKKLVRLMNGELIVSSNKNEGSTFTFILPFKKGMKKPNSQQQKLKIDTNTPLKGKRILLVEDDLFNQVLAIKVLEGVGCQVTTANNGEEAVSKTQNEQFDAILMDLHMPVLDGFEATKQIINSGNKTPILGFTADVLNDTRKKALAAGMQMVIPKPFVINELAAAIRGVV
ncbi:MAG: response regulator [Flavobacteriales bacterium]|nr:response regulator [Flavobacteriales bacterium]